MIEMAVWLLLSFGANGQAVTVSMHASEDACMETKQNILNSKYHTRSDKCVYGKVLVPK